MEMTQHSRPTTIRAAVLILFTHQALRHQKTEKSARRRPVGPICRMGPWSDLVLTLERSDQVKVPPGRQDLRGPWARRNRLNRIFFLWGLGRGKGILRRIRLSTLVGHDLIGW